MEKKPTYEELEQKIRELEREVIKYKRAEEVLRESEEKYRSLFEGSKNPITIMDRNGIVLMVNPIGRKNLNLPLQACIGKSIFEILPSLDKSYHKIYQQVVDKGTEVPREDLVELPSGPRWFGQCISLSQT
ncbi:MAG: PAS domain S-box protein [Pseudomonadota bacterium]